MKQSEFQELVINEFKEQKKFNEFVINEFGRVKSRCVKKIAIGITPVAFLNLFFPNSTSQKKNK